MREIIQDKYRNKSPIKGSDLDIAKTEWDPKTKRSGVIARNIGMYHMWQKDGTKVKCTLLQVYTLYSYSFQNPTTVSIFGLCLCYVGFG